MFILYFFPTWGCFVTRIYYFTVCKKNIFKTAAKYVTTASPSSSKDFMMELTAHQSSVGNVLQAGNQLIAQGNLTEEEENEIREQMSLLNSRWESLRVASMDRQAR